jgi:hypothetical protein
LNADAGANYSYIYWGTGSANAAAQNQILLGTAFGNDADQTIGLDIVIHNPDDTADYTAVTWKISGRTVAVAYDVDAYGGGAAWLSNSAVTSATLLFSAGNIDAPGDLYMIGHEDA